MATSTDCPGSWRPLPEAQLGDVVRCEVCGVKVGATLPPAFETTPHPWRGDEAFRVATHWHAGLLAPDRKTY